VTLSIPRNSSPRSPTNSARPSTGTSSSSCSSPATNPPSSTSSATTRPRASSESDRTCPSPLHRRQQLRPVRALRTPRALEHRPASRRHRPGTTRPHPRRVVLRELLADRRRSPRRRRGTAPLDYQSFRHAVFAATLPEPGRPHHSNRRSQTRPGRRRLPRTHRPRRRRPPILVDPPNSRFAVENALIETADDDRVAVGGPGAFLEDYEARSVTLDYAD